MALGFAATDTFVLHIQARRETQTISLSEIPLVLGLYFAAPMAMLVGRLVGSAAVMIVLPPVAAAEDRLQPGAARCPRPALALAMFRASRRPRPGAGPATWLAAYAAAFAADVMGVVAISCVIAARDGGVRPPGPVLRRRIAARCPRSR